ncbi:MAG: hypothetical protein IPK50_09435 [Fibrobacterota bacterium]|nr:hypothetical protein [Fibrobacterota bacterium]QQS07100.1 MAG: hypothetical protein IPK50_09435 [Fibrobacterota bacterium]
MSYLERTILRKFPQLYFALAALILGAKILGVPPTGFMPLPLILVVVVLCCVFGVMGIRALKAQS